MKVGCDLDLQKARTLRFWLHLHIEQLALDLDRIMGERGLIMQLRDMRWGEAIQTLQMADHFSPKVFAIFQMVRSEKHLQVQSLEQPLQTSPMMALRKWPMRQSIDCTVLFQRGAIRHFSNALLC